METIYQSSLKLYEYSGIKYVYIPWTEEELTKNRKGIILADLHKKKAMWFDTLHDAVDFLDAKRMSKEDYRSINKQEFFKTCNLTSEERVFDNYYVSFAYDFNIEKAKKNFANLSAPIINDKNEKFLSIHYAADHLINKGIAKGKQKTVVNSLKRNLKGETSKSYGRVWRFAGKEETNE